MWKRAVVIGFLFLNSILLYNCSLEGQYREPDFGKDYNGSLYIFPESEDIGANFVGDLFLYKNYIKKIV